MKPRTLIYRMAWKKKTTWKEIDLSTFDPVAKTAVIKGVKKKLNNEDLVLIAEAMIRVADAEAGVRSDVLFEDQLTQRKRKEVQARSWNTGGIIDPTITTTNSPDGQTMYNRYHEEGRKINSKKQRQSNGASWWR